MMLCKGESSDSKHLFAFAWLVAIVVGGAIYIVFMIIAGVFLNGIIVGLVYWLIGYYFYLCILSYARGG